MRVNEVYDRLTVQGEGPHIGRVCTFVRLYGCNLHCRWCDTPYTWDTGGRNGTVFKMADERHDMSVEQVRNDVLATGAPLCVVSGGEPLLQYSTVLALAHQLVAYGVATHVETNGTINPTPDLDPIEHYSVSPKLASADAGPPERAMHLATLQRWAAHPRAIFKIVCSTTADVNVAARLYDELRLRPEQRWVMPEALTAVELDQRLPGLLAAALGHRINVSTRLHVQAWGTTRGR